MACFLVPATEAVVTTIATKVVESKEKKAAGDESALAKIDAKKNNFSRKMKWLNAMLWGGSALLAFEHLWHGEITPFFPFLTAAADPADAAEMLHEMATSGVGMAVLVTTVWVVMVLVSASIEKRSEKEPAKEV